MAIKKAPMGVDKDLSTRIDALDGAGEIELTMLAANAEGKVIVYNASQVATAVAMSGDATIAATGAVTIGAKKVTAAKTALANGKILVGGADGAAAEKTMSGAGTLTNEGAFALANDAVSQAKVTDDAIGAAELKVVERDITVAGGASTGTITTAADVNGLILGFHVSNAESAVKTIALDAGTGKIDVTMMGAQAGGQDAHIFVKVLQV